MLSGAYSSTENIFFMKNTVVLIIDMFWRLMKILSDFKGRTWRQSNYPNQLAPKRGTRGTRGGWVLTPTTPGELIRQSLFCSGLAHSQQGVLSAHCSRQPHEPLMALLITCTLLEQLWFLKCKKFLKQINCVHIDIFHQKWYRFKIRMEFLQPILVKIELIYQQPAMTRPTGVIWVVSPAMGCWIGWLGADAVIWICKRWKTHWPIKKKMTSGIQDMSVWILVNYAHI